MSPVAAAVAEQHNRFVDVALKRNEHGFQPRGAAVDFWRARDPEVLICGPAGTGKSRVALEKMHALAKKYPGFKGMIVRATRESLTNSLMPIFEEEVMLPGEFGTHKGSYVRYHTGKQRYEYRNGSFIVTAGMDNPGKAMSAQYHVIYVNEAIELTRDAWEKLTTRLRGPGGPPYRQMIADTNPDHPNHWLKGRCDDGITRLITSTHKDNPTVWDGRAGKPTPEGEQYLAKLDALTGVRRKRLRDGEWAAAEGMVYEGWDDDVHVVERPTVEAVSSWRRLWTVDFGLRDPFVWQNWLLDPDDNLYLYQEIYVTGRTIPQLAPLIWEVFGDQPFPEAVVCDHDASERALFEEYVGLRTKTATKTIQAGVQAVKNRLVIHANGRPRLVCCRHADALVDAELAREKEPLSFRDEILAYEWDVRNGKKKGDVPIDKHNHAMDAMRYAVAHVDKITAGIGAKEVALPVSMTKESYFRNSA